jgi:hypothetical protein
MNIWDLWWRCSSTIPLVWASMNIYHIPYRVLIDSLSLIMNIKNWTQWDLRHNLFFSFLRKCAKRQRQLFFFKKKSPKRGHWFTFWVKIHAYFFPQKKSSKLAVFFPPSLSWLVTCLSTSYYLNGALTKAHCVNHFYCGSEITLTIHTPH